MKFKNDRYKKARGGYSRMLEIHCEKCGSYVCEYQKDGSGNLKRMYHDRIFNPKISISNKSLKCPQGHLLGMKMIYKKENRPAFHLLADAVKKKIIKSKAKHA